MALMQVGFFSAQLGLRMNMNVLVPQSGDGERKFKVLYLLHGLSDDCSMWCRNTRIEPYVEQLPLIVVMPEVHRSFYADMHAGGRYWSFVSEELPQLVRGFFHISEARCDTYVAGLSMGGYGALKLALRRPERFGHCAAFSGALRPEQLLRVADRKELQPEFGNMFGNEADFLGGENDLFTLAEKAAALPEEQRTALHLFCGSEDFLIAHNREFHARLDRLGYPHDYTEAPGVHCWEFWDDCIRQTLEEWFPPETR